ncbi:MAG: tetratricopeptide repeat protein [Bacteroidales bacterium]|nr:tetratricopeptide repeat protein [Bacteroidales bacterium]
MKNKSILFLGLLLALFACNNTPKPETNDKPQAPTAPKSVTEAIQLLTDSIAMDSTNARLYLSRAKAYFANEQIGQAMVDINSSLQFDPNNIDTYLLLADVYYALGDEANIASTLNRAAEIDPMDARPLVKLAELNLLQQNFNLAMGYVDKALGLSTYNPRAYFVKGMCFMAAKQDTANAMKNFQIASEQDGTFYDPVEQISRIYAAQQPPYAMDYLRKAQQQFPDMPTARYELALYLQSHGEPEEALLHYDTLLMQRPDNYIVLFNKGYVNYVYLEDNEAALDYFNQTLAVKPDYLDAKYNKGRVLEQMGDYSQAMDIYKDVLRTQPNYQLAIDAINRIQNQETE